MEAQTLTNVGPQVNDSQPNRKAGALAGTIVVELGMVMQVPLAGQMLGDFGADVIKVERRNPVHLTRTPAGYFRAPALLGENNDEVLAEFGFSATGIKRLRAAGVLSEDPRIDRTAGRARPAQ